MLTKKIILILLFIQTTNVIANNTYYPPFEKGKHYLVSQGFYGQFTHHSITNTYAIDLNIPQGDSVCAAEAGVVYQLRKEQKSPNDALFVHIQHEDGTIADYHHLQAGSFDNIDVGQTIKQGECFARAGQTGNATGAHLHFAILQKKNGKLVSIPFQFIGKKGTYWPEYLRWVEW